MATCGKLESLVTFGATSGGFINGATGFGVVPGNYYLSTAEESGGLSLIAELESVLNGAGSGIAFTVSIDAGEGGTGKVTITADTDCTIVWESTTLRDVLGFADDLPLADSWVSPYQARALWLPNVSYLNLNGGGQWRGWIESDLRIVESASGYVWAHSGQRRRVQDLAWQGIQRAKCWASNESTINESFERFYIDNILGEATWAEQPCGPIRFHADADQDDLFGTYKVAGGLEQMKPDQFFQNYGGQWVVRVPRLVQLPGSETLGLSSTIAITAHDDPTAAGPGTSLSISAFPTTTTAKLYVVFVGSSTAALAGTPTVSGAGLTWAVAETVDIPGANGARLTMHWAWGIPSGAGVTVSWGANSNGRGASAFIISGTKSGSDAFSETVTATATASDAISTVNTPPTHVNNVCLNFRIANNNVVGSDDADFTNLTDWFAAGDLYDMAGVASYATGQFICDAIDYGTENLAAIGVMLECNR